MAAELVNYPNAPGPARGAPTSRSAALSPSGSPGTLARMCAELWGLIHEGNTPTEDEAIKLAMNASKWSQMNKEAGNAVRRREAFSEYMADRYKSRFTALLNACCKGAATPKLTSEEFATKRALAFKQAYRRDFSNFHDENGVPTSRPVWISSPLPEFQLCDPSWEEFARTVPCRGAKSRGGKRSTRRSKKSKRSTRRRAY